MHLKIRVFCYKRATSCSIGLVSFILACMLFLYAYMCFLVTCDVALYLRIFSLYYCSMIICVFLSFVFDNVLRLYASWCFFLVCDVALYSYISSLCNGKCWFIYLFVLVIKIITLRWLLYPYFWHFYILCLFVLFTHRFHYNGILYDCHTLRG